MPDATPRTSKPTTPASGSELPPRLLAKLKVEIEGYELLDRLGEGGQATVYKAIQKKDGQTVAVKVLHAGPHATEEARARLKREINALRAINHPNIVQAIAAGRTRSGLDCLVMNFIEGRPLDDLWNDPAFAAKVAPQPADVLRLFKTICETVQAAHRKGITHRDLSPSNILIDASGQPHILDFGMASTAFDGIVTRNVTVTGQFIGKLKYASPEQASGARTPGAAGEAGASGVDIRSDVYALGVMLYQLLTGGAFPYEVVGNVIDVLNNIIHSKPRPPSQAAAELRTPTAAMVVPKTGPATAPAAPFRRNPPLVNESIEAIVLKALEKDPAQRYQSAGELAADIDRYLAGQPTSAVVWSKRPGSKAPSRSFRRAATVAASVVLVATLVGVTMNAKSLAVWLGLATAAAPILPTELAPLSPQPARAATTAAALGDETDGQLTDLAHELARVEARLHAVNSLIEANTRRQPPDTGAAGKPPTQWLSADAFAETVIKAAAEHGRTITIAPLDAAAREDIKQAESTATGADPSEDALLLRRAALDAQFAILCSRFSWGAFTGRDDDRLFRLGTTVAPDANPAAMANKGVIDAGVRFRRTLDAALTQAATALRGDAAGGEAAAPDLRTVLDTVADQTKPSLDAFRKAIDNARDQEGRTEEDVKTLSALASTAKDLAAALADAATAKNHPDQTADEPARAAALARLQRSLRQMGELGAGVETRLVSLRQTWAVALDPNRELAEIRLTRAARPQPPVRQTPKQPIASLRDQFPIGSIWRISEEGTGTVVRVQDDTVTMNMKWPTSAPRVFTLQVRGNEVSLIRDEAAGARPDGKPAAIVTNLNVTGTLLDGKITLQGSRSRSSGNGVPIVEQISYTFDIQRQSAAAVVTIADIFPPGSTWTGTWQRGTFAAAKTTANVTQSAGDAATLRFSIQGLGNFDMRLELRNGEVHLVSFKPVDARQQDGNTFAEHSKFDISGPADDKARAGTVVLTGEWHWSRPGRGGRENNRFELFRDNR